MASRVTRMTHEEHLDLAQKLTPAFATIQSAAINVINKNGVTSWEGRKMVLLMKHVDAARSALDKAYHAVTSNDEFSNAGHVYYRSESKK